MIMYVKSIKDKTDKEAELSNNLSLSYIINQEKLLRKATYYKSSTTTKDNIKSFLGCFYLVVLDVVITNRRFLIKHQIQVFRS